MADIDWIINITKTLNFFSYPPVKDPIKPPKANPIIGPITVVSIYTYSLWNEFFSFKIFSK